MISRAREEAGERVLQQQRQERYLRAVTISQQLNILQQQPFDSDSPSYSLMLSTKVKEKLSQVSVPFLFHLFILVANDHFPKSQKEKLQVP